MSPAAESAVGKLSRPPNYSQFDAHRILHIHTTCQKCTSHKQKFYLARIPGNVFLLRNSVAIACRNNNIIYCTLKFNSRFWLRAWAYTEAANKPFIKDVKHKRKPTSFPQPHLSKSRDELYVPCTQNTVFTTAPFTTISHCSHFRFRCSSETSATYLQSCRVSFCDKTLEITRLIS